MADDALWRLGAADMAALVRRREVTREEVLASCVDRAQAVNPSLNAITLTEDLAVTEARPGRPLDGVPVVINENTDQQGAATTLGIPALKDNIAAEDAPLVAALREDGALFLGRGHTPDFSLRFHSGSSLHGQVMNPRDPAITPGGSSGGSAVAVASGMVPIAHGNDLGGSVRYPAYCCGVLGLKFSAGRVPSFNRSLPERSGMLDMMAQQGIFARSVADIAIAARTLMRPAAQDPWSLEAVGPSYSSERKMTVAVLEPSAGESWHDDVQEAVGTAAAALAACGGVVRHVPAPHLADTVETWGGLLFSEARHGQVDAVRRHGGDDVNRVLESYLEIFPELSPAELFQALTRRTTIARRWSALFDGYDAVLMPVLTTVAPALDSDLQGPDSVASLLRSARYCIAGNLAGFPGLTLPIPTSGGSISAVQIAAWRFNEEAIFRVAAIVEEILGRQRIAA